MSYTTKNQTPPYVGGVDASFSINNSSGQRKGKKEETKKEERKKRERKKEESGRDHFLRHVSSL